MSDALTDIARDEQRAREFDQFARRVLDYLTVPARTAEKYEAVKQAAAATDGVPRGYWGGRTTLLDGVDRLLKGLAAGDDRTWAQWLNEVSPDFSVYDKFLAISPFADKVLVTKRYRHLEYASVAAWAYTHKVDLGDIAVLVFDPPKVIILKERK